MTVTRPVTPGRIRLDGNTTIAGLVARDIRFRTSESLAGSDAMNPDPDYSAAYVVIELDSDDDVAGHAFAFTIGRGNDVQCAAIRALAPLIVGQPAAAVLADLGEFSRRLTHDSQLRWLGPEKGVMHMAISAVLNALWDLRAKIEGKPLWRLLTGLAPEEIVDLVDFRYISDALTPTEALDLLRSGTTGRAERERELIQTGYPAYTTGPGWLGYDDQTMTRLIEEALADGFTQIKLKVGADLHTDIRRMALARSLCGPDVRIAVDANQRWDRHDAIERIRALEPFDPYWVEEPTSPDDILGHAAIARAVAPIRIATGEQAANRVIFKQLLQAQAVSVVQIDAARVGGVNENIAILLMAAKFGVPVCPHAGGVGLCEMVRHLSFFDYTSVSRSLDGRCIEYVDSLHEHFLDPALVVQGRYLAPMRAGFSTEMHPQSLDDHAYPTGAVWRSDFPTGRSS